jgi:hypothetical protein
MQTTSETSGEPVDRLIQGLASDLKPVHRLASPALRALMWLAFVAAVGLALSTIADLHALQQRLEATPDMWLAMIGSALTAVLAAIAAFELSLPDSPRGWIWLPVPAAVLWVTASGLGCLRQYLIPGTHVASLHETMSCLSFILGFSVPFSALLFLMLRQAFPLLPGLTAAAAGLAAAAAAATLLNLFHPFDAAVVDLTVHAVAVALVIVAARIVGARSLRKTNFSPPA